MPSYQNNTFDDIVYRNSTYYGTAAYLRSSVTNQANSWEPVSGENVIKSLNDCVSTSEIPLLTTGTIINEENILVHYFSSTASGRYAGSGKEMTISNLKKTNTYLVVGQDYVHDSYLVMKEWYNVDSGCISNGEFVKNYYYLIIPIKNDTALVSQRWYNTSTNPQGVVSQLKQQPCTRSVKKRVINSTSEAVHPFDKFFKGIFVRGGTTIMGDRIPLYTITNTDYITQITVQGEDRQVSATNTYIVSYSYASSYFNLINSDTCTIKQGEHNYDIVTTYQ